MHDRGMALARDVVCSLCGATPLVMMKRLDTGAVFAECRACSTGTSAGGETFSTADAYWERREATWEETTANGWVSVRRLGSMPSAEQHPSPELAAAWFVLDRLPLERAPWYAANWLVDGHDGEMLLRLAGQDGSDVLSVRDELPHVFAELDVRLPSQLEAAQVAFRSIATLYLDGRLPARDVAAMVDHVVAATDYDSSVFASPLGGLFGLSDEWEGGWGRSDALLSGEVHRACQEQLA